jgi:hypothetical protein
MSQVYTFDFKFIVKDLILLSENTFDPSNLTIQVKDFFK